MRQQATRQRAERPLSIRTRCEIPRDPSVLGTLPPTPSISTGPGSGRVSNLHAQPEASRASVQEGQPGTPCLFRSYFARPSSGRPSSGRRNHLVLDREPPRLRPPSRGPLRIFRVRMERPTHTGTVGYGLPGISVSRPRRPLPRPMRVNNHRRSPRPCHATRSAAPEASAWGSSHIESGCSAQDMMRFSKRAMRGWDVFHGKTTQVDATMLVG